MFNLDRPGQVLGQLAFGVLSVARFPLFARRDLDRELQTTASDAANEETREEEEQSYKIDQDRLGDCMSDLAQQILRDTDVIETTSNVETQEKDDKVPEPQGLPIEDASYLEENLETKEQAQPRGLEEEEEKESTEQQAMRSSSSKVHQEKKKSSETTKKKKKSEDTSIMKSPKDTSVMRSPKGTSVMKSPKQKTSSSASATTPVMKSPKQKTSSSSAATTPVMKSPKQKTSSSSSATPVMESPKQKTSSSSAATTPASGTVKSERTKTKKQPGSGSSRQSTSSSEVKTHVGESRNKRPRDVAQAPSSQQKKVHLVVDSDSESEV